jgi:CubicO group peptidase (beta-lactamase class C family)
MGWGLANVDVVNNSEYGWDGTAGTIFWIDPSQEMVTVLMTQSSPSNPDQIRQHFKAIVREAIVNGVRAARSGRLRGQHAADRL